MKKLLIALLLFVAVYYAHGQTPYFPSGVNYGGGLVIKETQGSGAPASSCTGFVRYWQTDASGSTSPMWQCNVSTSTMVNMSGTGGGASFAVTTTATGLQSIAGPLASQYFQVGNADTTLWRCGTKCLSLGSSNTATDGSFKTFSLNGSINGILNATLYTGSDIFAKITAAWTACGNACTVYVPAGSYTASTTLTMPNVQTVYKLEMDPATVINYTGTANAIETPTIEGGTNHLDGIEGGWIVGTASGKNGIHINPINHFYIKHVKVSGFTNTASQLVGNGILDAGGNSIEIEDVSLFDNTTGLGGTEVTGFSSIAVHVSDSDISENNGWGVATFDSHVSATQENSWVIRDNVIEDNGTGGVDLAHSNSSTIADNHFEQGGIPVRLNNGYNGNGNKAIGNFFITGSGHNFQVQVVNGFNTQVEWNYEVLAAGSPSPCFISVVNASNIQEDHNIIASTNERCYPGTNPGWLRQFDNTLQTGTITSPTGDPVVFPQGMSTTGTVSGGVVSSTGNLVAGNCVTVHSGGPQICSGGGAPSISCSIGGSLWLNAGATSGTYPYYVCRNGAWNGQGTIY